MEEHFEDYRAFDSIETARFVLLDMLEANNIPYTLYKDAYRQDVILGQGIGLTDVWVRIRPDDFKKVDNLMLSAAEERYTEIPADYYLREMETTELLDVLKQSDMWSIDDFVIARKLLEERGIPVSPDKIEAWAEERQKQLLHEKWVITPGNEGAQTGIIEGPGVASSAVLDYKPAIKGRKDIAPGKWRKGQIFVYLFIAIILLRFLIVFIYNWYLNS